MTNRELTKKILNKINGRSHKLSRSIVIDDEIMTEIVFNDKETGSYIWCIANNHWELPLCLLTNRELTKLYQSL